MCRLCWSFRDRIREVWLSAYQTVLPLGKTESPFGYKRMAKNLNLSNENPCYKSSPILESSKRNILTNFLLVQEKVFIIIGTFMCLDLIYILDTGKPRKTLFFEVIRDGEGDS